jgi:uncharacterized protein (DUF952 family)
MAGSIFHITSPSDAEQLLEAGRLSPDSLEAEGFVHCSTAAQVVGSTARHFGADANLVLIELDPQLVEHEISWPEVYPGQRYPHVHGPLSASSVVAVHLWREADRARWSPDPAG